MFISVRTRVTLCGSKPSGAWSDACIPRRATKHAVTSSVHNAICRPSSTSRTENRRSIPRSPPIPSSPAPRSCAIPAAPAATRRPAHWQWKALAPPQRRAHPRSRPRESAFRYRRPCRSSHAAATPLCPCPARRLRAKPVAPPAAAPSESAIAPPQSPAGSLAPARAGPPAPQRCWPGSRTPPPAPAAKAPVLPQESRAPAPRLCPQRAPASPAAPIAHILMRIQPRHLVCRRVQVRFRLRLRHLRPQPPQDHTIRGSCRLVRKLKALRLLLVDHRHPRIRPDRYLCTVESRRRHAQDRERMLVDLDRAPHHRRIRMEPALPVAVAQHHVGRGVQPALIGPL